MKSSGFQLGGLTLRVVSGGRFRLDGGGMFGVVPKALWSRQAPPDELNRIELDTSCLLLERDGFAGLPREVQLRLLAGGIGFVSGTVRRPRAARLEEVLDQVQIGANGGRVRKLLRMGPIGGRGPGRLSLKCGDHR